ncbi:hypothetical protein DSM112329_01727 [Paraconexibacter sp. AEG42_29]|uniref:DUF998 domain-containing protein n=1 Tax=Paraconexibacter sp. AEG42_29 TaxID=2997339 RepID=A0AAU7ATF5_9ACTN
MALLQHERETPVAPRAAAGVPLDITLQRICTWSGPIFVAVFFTGILVAGWLPPVSANQTAAQVKAMYLQDTDQIRLGAVLIGMSSFFQGVWAAVMSVQLRRIEGHRPLLTYAQLAAGGVGMFVVILPAFIFAAAAFHPERSADVTQALHDFGWLALVGVGWPAILQCVAVAAATLTDGSEHPVFPRWFGWFNLWTAFGFLPGPFLVFFHAGPFAWSGAAAFWLPAVVFSLWFPVWFVVLRRAITAEANERMSSARTRDAGVRT